MNRPFIKWLYRGIVVLCLFSGIDTMWADWPQYLGPKRNGVSTETGLATSWPPSGPPVLWRIELGPGYGGAAIQSGKVFFVDYDPTKQEILRCLDLSTGQELWRYAYPVPGELPFMGSRATPTVDGNFVFMVGIYGHFHCIDQTLQRPVWSQDLQEKFSINLNMYGVGQSPLLYQNTVIVVVQGKDCGLVAFDKNSGAVLWKGPPIPGTSCYASPSLIRIGGIDQIIAQNGHFNIENVEGGTFGYNAKNGELLWAYQGIQHRHAIPPPVIFEDGRLFITGGFGGGSAMIQIHRYQDRFAVDEVFTTTKCGPQLHPPIFFNGFLYANSNQTSIPSAKAINSGMICMDLDGKLLWSTGRKNSNFQLGSVIMVDQKLVVLDGKRGTLHLVKPSPRQFQELAAAKILQAKDRQAWAPLAFSNGKLIARDSHEMVCVALGQP
jgi:outer membrane protein assembly factor BamB